MNVIITHDSDEASILAQHDKASRVKKLQLELDDIFYSTIRTPKEVFNTYEKLLEFKLLTGTDYKITSKENTIV